MEVKKAILKFSENIHAKLYHSPLNWEDIKSGKEVKENDRLYFQIEDIEGKKIEKWLMNGKEVLDCGDVFLRYTVLAKDMVEENGVNVLALQAVLQDAIKIKMLFERGMKCRYHGKKFIHASYVEEGRFLHFSRKKEEGTIFENWLVNGKIAGEYIEAAEEVGYFTYLVNKDDAKEEEKDAVIEVKLTSRSALKAHLILENSMICSSKLIHFKRRKLAQEDEVWEGLKLNFCIDEKAFIGNETLKDDLVVDRWLINGKEFVPNYHFFDHITPTKIYREPLKISIFRGLP